MTNPEKTWLTIVNPNAGRKKIEKDWVEIKNLLDASGLTFEIIRTQHRDHAISLAKENVVAGYRKFLVIGGDGTLNEVVNGIFGQSVVPHSEVVVGLIPVGTGNDWCRMFHIPFDYQAALDLIVKESTFTQDVGKVTYFNSGDKKCRFFINVAGMGYDAEVAARTNIDKDRGRGGPMVYLKNLFSSLLFYNFTNTKIIIDHRYDNPSIQPTFSISVGIGRYNGGGMMQLPEALPGDGLLDMTLIKKLGKLTIIKEVKNLYDGSFIKHPKVMTFRGTSFKVDSDPAINLEADGESLGHSPFVFSIIPASLKVVVGRSEF